MDEVIDDISENDLGVRLRQLRLDKGWVLGRLAEESGLSEAYLSRVETGARTPSLGTIFSVARALGVPVGEVFDKPEADAGYTIHRHEDHAGEVVGGQAVGLSSSAAWSSLEAVRLTLAANHPGVASRHRGEEFVLVLSGDVRVNLETTTVDLATGDSIHFDASMEHILAASAGKAADVLLIAADSKLATGPNAHKHAY